MKLFVTGAGGQLGHELVEAIRAAGHEAIATTHAQLDITDEEAVRIAIGSAKHCVVIHAAAWTAVDACEGDVAKAMLVNGTASQYVADAAHAVGARVVYISTDYVFDGSKPTPYNEDDTPNPQSSYGASKLAGERAMGADDAIVRISWVCGFHGANMVKTILKLGATMPELKFVDDQIGNPTFADDAAKAIVRIQNGASDGAKAGELIGVHCHIGSNVLAVNSFAKAAEIMAEFSKPYGLPELTLGGGLGVAYTEGEEAPTITMWGSVLLDACETLGVTAEVSVEPGRAIVASSAITVYRVGTVKEIPGIRTYISVDGGMSDNPRPVLYGSGYEAFKVSDVKAERPLTARLVGKHCESGDILIFEGQFPSDIAVDDLIATPVTGAYGHSMASNYNKVPRPAVVFVANGESRLVIRRENYEDLVRLDVS